MKSTETFSKFLLNRLGRSLYAIVGLLIFALGSYFQIQANFGMSPWNSLSQGLSMNYPVTFGTANIIVSFIIIFVDILMKEPIGIGTILNAIVIGAGTDVFLAIGFLPTQTTFIGKLLVLVAGIVITCLGQFVYMKACLSCGPRDSLMVGLGKRFPKVKPHSINPVSKVSSEENVFFFLVFFFSGKIFSPEKYALMMLFNSILLPSALRPCNLQI